MLRLVANKLEADKVECSFVIPYSRGDLCAYIRERGRVDSEEYLAEGTAITCTVEKAVYGYVAKQLGISVKEDPED